MNTNNMVNFLDRADQRKREVSDVVVGSEMQSPPRRAQVGVLRRGGVGERSLRSRKTALS